MRDRRLAHVECATKVDIEHGVIVFGLDFHELKWLCDAGIIDQYVHPAKLTNDPIDGSKASAFVGHVTREAAMFRPDFSGGRLCLLLVEVQDDGTPTMLGKHASRRASNTSRR